MGHHPLKCECNLRASQPDAGCVAGKPLPLLSPCTNALRPLSPSRDAVEEAPSGCIFGLCLGTAGAAAPVRLEQSEPSQPPRREQLFQASSNQKQGCRAGGEGVSPGSPAPLQGWLEITCAALPGRGAPGHAPAHGQQDHPRPPSEEPRQCRAAPRWQLQPDVLVSNCLCNYLTSSHQHLWEQALTWDGCSRGGGWPREERSLSSRHG